MKNIIGLLFLLFISFMLVSCSNQDETITIDQADAHSDESLTVQEQDTHSSDGSFKQIMGLVLTLVIGTALFYFHPNRKHAATDKTALLSYLEKADPLMITYIAKDGALNEDDIIAGIFSLHHRGLISISEVRSLISAGSTFRFTWKRSTTTLVESDQFLKEWLFTNKDEHGSYFLLESMGEIIEENPSRTTKKKQRNLFREKFLAWRKLTTEKTMLKKNANHFIPYYLLSISLIFFTLGMAIHFVFDQAWSQVLQYALVILLTLLASLVILSSYHRMLLSIFFGAEFLLTIFFIPTTAQALFMLFLIIAGSLPFLISKFYWTDDIAYLPMAIKLARKLFKSKLYPMGNTPKAIQKQMQLAIILGLAKNHAEVHKQIPASLLANGNYPLLHDPKRTAAVFNNAAKPVPFI